jgi:hypothetical protein
MHPTRLNAAGAVIVPTIAMLFAPDVRRLRSGAQTAIGLYVVKSTCNGDVY